MVAYRGGAAVLSLANMPLTSAMASDAGAASEKRSL